MPIITISNETGCGKEICDALEKRLNYKIINKDIVRYAAILGGITPDQANMLDEKNYSKLKTLLSQYIDLSLFSPADMLTIEKDEVKKQYNYRPYEYANTPSGENFQNAMEKVIRMLANEGNVLIFGRGSNFILSDRADTLHLRIVSPLKTRVENVMKSMEMTETQAVKHIYAVDKSKTSYIKNYFNSDISSALNYHAVINEGNTDPEKTALAIIEMLK